MMAFLKETKPKVVDKTKTKSQYPPYFFKPDSNLLDSMQQKKAYPAPAEPNSFNLHEPESRIRKHLYNYQQSVAQENTVANGLTGTIKAGKATFHLTADVSEIAELVPSKDANYKLFLGKKLTNDEVKRVKSLQIAKQTQLDNEQELRVKQLLKDKRETLREKNYNKLLKEESESAKAKFEKLDFVRSEHYEKTQQKY